MAKYLSLLFFIFICISYDSSCAGQVSTDLTLHVEGSAQIIKNDVARAREEAVKNALEKAIMQASAKILLHKYEEEKFQAVKSVMISKVDRYIKNYRITAENRQQDEYIASLSVVVALATVKDDLFQMGILQDQQGKESTSVSLSLKGITKYSDFSHLKTFLQNRPKIVRSIYPCRLEWQQAHCDIIIAGDVQNLAAEFEKTGRYSLEPLKKNQEIIEINLQVK
jgi:hypothetical protein